MLPRTANAMSSSALLGRNVSGYVYSDGKRLPCSGFSGRVVSVSPCSSFAVSKGHFQIKSTSLKCGSSRASFLCKASNSGQKRNPDFSRPNRHGFSRGRNRQTEERDSFDNLDDTEMLSSKNGPLLSLSSSPRSQATAVPGPREKEIVELFRKIQAQLRERAAMKEEKKNEATKGQGKESETVDSLLKLLRKHSVEQSKRKGISGGSRDLTLEQPKQNLLSNEEKGSGIFDSNSILGDESRDSNASLSRPASKFERQSPIPRVKYQSINFGDDSDDSTSIANLSGRKNKDRVEKHPEPLHEPSEDPEPELELEAEAKTVISDGGLDDEMDAESSDADEAGDNESMDQQGLVDETDLNALKLPELRALAKSRGVKGFSKMKKSALVELLSGSSG
ncbi:rho-N domain-containing protein 1, chloroplastic-like [Rhodamnia argentea]|uniref:Rho-N domain-containing protein 1, chloroplastic-like n=1 Tax=Rhodamnia argentea TaxID=178133 RepID=A0ABM3HKG9_9MYRT|nr:rho-N domain-containing protein 1, chloroplastic-like [Rhodamnia argentea]